ncbi:ADP-ribose pyrophosphatase-like protein, partial [Leptotrombidium deliense]
RECHMIGAICRVRFTESLKLLANIRLLFAFSFFFSTLKLTVRHEFNSDECIGDILVHEVYMNYAGKQILRFKVPPQLKCWTVDFPDYKPTQFSLDFSGKEWADPNIGEAGFNPKWNAVDGEVNRQSHEGEYKVVNGYPLNPSGRTGISGRGNRGKWGPNHAGDAVVTRWKRDHTNQIIHDKLTNLPILQFVSILRKDDNQWAIPGGHVDVGEHVAAAVKREFFEEALNSKYLSGNDIDSIEKSLNSFFENGVEIYRGVVDDPRNTDNAWMETVVYNFHDESGEVLRNINFIAGDDAIGVKWLDISSTLKLFANHLTFIEKTVRKLKAYF